MKVKLKDIKVKRLYIRHNCGGRIYHIDNKHKASGNRKSKTKRVPYVVHIVAGSQDHTDADCFGCAILTHGDETKIFGTDGTITPHELFAPLKGDKCPTLLLKPKLFFIQVSKFYYMVFTLQSTYSIEYVFME